MFILFIFTILYRGVTVRHCLMNIFMNIFVLDDVHLQGVALLQLRLLVVAGGQQKLVTRRAQAPRRSHSRLIMRGRWLRTASTTVGSLSWLQ